MDLKKYYDESAFEHDAVLHSGEFEYPRSLNFCGVTFVQMQERLKMSCHVMRMKELEKVLRQVADNHKRKFWRYGHEQTKEKT